ncbi:MAG: hypothetical protein ACRCU3_02955 [Eubacteriaceae bacterium]
MFDPKDIVRFLLSFFLIVILVFFQSLLFIDLVLLNPISYFGYINTPAYYEKLRDQIDFGLEEVGRFANVPSKVLSDAVSDVEIKDYTQTATKEMLAFLKGNKEEYTLKFDTTKLRNSIENYVIDYTKQRNQPYTEELQREVENIAEMAGNRVETYTMVIDPTLLKELKIDKRLQEILSKLFLGEVLGLCLMIVLVFGLWLTNKNHRMRTFWWLGSSLLVSSITLLIPGLTLAFMNIGGRIGVRDTYFTWIVEHGINELILKWNTLQFAFLLLGAILMLIYVLYRRYKIKKEKRTVRMETTF